MNNKAISVPDFVVTENIENFHLDNKSNFDARFLEYDGLRQHVNAPTHNEGLTLGATISGELSCTIAEVPSVYDPSLGNKCNLLGDHTAVMFLIGQLHIRCITTSAFQNSSGVYQPMTCWSLKQRHPVYHQ